ELDQGLVDDLARGLPELPDEKKARLMSDYGLSAYDAGVLVADAEDAAYFEAVASGRDAKLAVNWVMGDLSAHANAAGTSIAGLGVPPGHLGAGIHLRPGRPISGQTRKDG